MPTKLVFQSSEGVRVSPAIWPDNKVKVQPGDFTLLPEGSGLYGYQKNGFNPLLAAPQESATGGFLYFGNRVTREQLRAMLDLLEIRREDRDYAVFVTSAKKPGKEGHLNQMRIVSRFGLRFMFGALKEKDYDSFPLQSLHILDVLLLFIKKEREQWGTSFTQDKEKGLRGMFGGDGDSEREELCFGFMQENRYHGVCRIWSRAQLVTK